MTYIALILSIDVETSSGKVASNIVKGEQGLCRGNAAMAWERLRNKYESTSAPSLVKTERMFRQSSFYKNEDPDAWITTLEDNRMKLEVMGSSMTYNQFMIHVLNNLTSDYELQLALAERHKDDKESLLTVEEIQEELILCFERFNMKS